MTTLQEKLEELRETFPPFIASPSDIDQNSFENGWMEAIDAVLDLPEILGITHLPGGENLALCDAEIGDICENCMRIDEKLLNE